MAKTRLFPRLRRSSASKRPRVGNPNRSSRRSLTASGSGTSPGSLVAAGTRITQQDAEQMRRLVMEWQARAFTYYDSLGEINYAAQFYSRMLAPLRLFVAKRDENGDYVEIDHGTDKPVEAALDRVQDPGGGRESLLSSYGRLMFLTGECYLLCSLDEDTGLEQWEMLSTDELRVQSGVYIRYKAPSLMAEEFREAKDDDWAPTDAKTAVAYRLWKRHPRYSMLADSTMKGVLDTCEDLLLLTRAIRARARSRLAGSGILLVADGVSYVPAEPLPDEDIDEDAFLHDLKEAMLSSIANEGTPEAVVPLVMRVPDELIEKAIRHIQIVDPTQLYPETGLRREAIERIAIGLDMPPEILLGMADANHWTSWMIDEQTWKAHGQPIANQLVNDLNQAYFLPELRANGIEDWNQYAIRYDASAIINHPDRSKDAKDAYDRRSIGKQALRAATGFDEDDAPTDDELAEMIGVAVRDPSLAWFGEPSPRGGAVEIAPGVLESAEPGATPAEGATVGADVEPGPPNGGDAPSPNENLIGAAMRAERIAGAGDLALLRAREAAGNRVKSKAKRHPDLLALIENAPARDAVAILGPEGLRKLGVEPLELVQGIAELVEEAMRLWGVRVNGHAPLIAEQVVQHAVRTLFEPRPVPLPPQFRSYVSGVLGAP